MGGCRIENGPFYSIINLLEWVNHLRLHRIERVGHLKSWCTQLEQGGLLLGQLRPTTEYRRSVLGRVFGGWYSIEYEGGRVGHLVGWLAPAATLEYELLGWCASEETAHAPAMS
jgi:hypothetical protein